MYFEENPKRKRKISALPPLEKVDEEFNSNDLTKTLEMQIQTIQSNLQQIQLNLQEVQGYFRKLKGQN